MVQDFVQRAAPLSDRAAVDALGVPYALAVRELSEVFAECVFVHGYTHNDLHGGNVLVRQKPGSTSKAVDARRRRGAVARQTVVGVAYAALLLFVVASLAALAYCVAAAWTVPHPLARTVVFSLAIGCGLARAPDRDGLAALGVGLASLALGEHRKFLQFVDEACFATKAKFDLVLIDHGFHTDVPDAFRRTFCKLWAAIGLRDAQLLAEAAYELGLSDDPACLGDGVVPPGAGKGRDH